MKGGIDGEENDADGVSVDRALPLEYVIGTEEERGMGVSAVESGKRMIIRLV